MNLLSKTQMTELTVKLKVVLEFFSGLASCFSHVVSQKSIIEEGSTYIEQIIDYKGSRYITNSSASEIAYMYTCRQVYPLVVLVGKMLRVQIWTISAYSGQHRFMVIEYDLQKS